MRLRPYPALIIAFSLPGLTGFDGIAFSSTRAGDDPAPRADSLLAQKSVHPDSIEPPASRPLIGRNPTTVVRAVDQSFFTNIPARGINGAILLQPGVVVQGIDAIGMPAIHLRGGRVDEIGYSIEGVNVSDVLFGGRAVAVTAEALEQIQVRAGGSGAGEGGVSSGVVGMQLRTGHADRWGGSLIAETDRFTGMNRSALGVYSYGYSDWTGTIGGPFPGLGSALRLFGSVQNTFYRDPAASIRSGWNFSGANAIVTDPGATQFHSADSRSDTLNLSFPGGNALGGQDNRWIVTGTALLDVSPFQVRVAGSYSYDRSRTPTVLENMFNQSRLPLNIERDGFFTVKFSHALSHSVSYGVSLNYFGKSYVTEDPQMLGNLFAYGDPAANAALGYTLRSAGGQTSNWPAYSLWGGAFQINEPGTQIAGYEKDDQMSLGGRAGMTLELEGHEVNIGGEFTPYTIRRYSPSNVFNWRNISNRYPDRASLELSLIEQIGTDTYGYDVFGRPIDGDDIRNGSLYYIGPRRPVFAAAYIQDRIELPDVILDLGLRYDYIDPDSKDVENPYYLQFGSDGLLIASQIKRTKLTRQVSPRIGLSLPLGDRNTIHAHYGKFVQQSELKDSYAGSGRMANLIRSDGFYPDTFGWGLKPTRVTQYEAGFSRQLNDFASFDVTAFYKETSDLATLVSLPFDESYRNYFSFTNDDFATSKGMEFVFTLLRTRRVAAQVNYTFQDLRGTGSTPTDRAGAWSSGSIVQLPGYARPLDFNQAHRGSIQIDYRFGKGDGGEILEQLGLNLLLTFNSGHSFTVLTEPQRGPSPTDPRYQIPVEPIGSSNTPWFFQLDGRIDKMIFWGPVGLDVYLYAINLLGTENPVDVFPRTGDPSSDGWLLTSGGQTDVLQNGPQYVAYYHAVNNGRNSGNWGPPRQIRFGVRLDY
jgi:hypothetical protein